MLPTAVVNATAESIFAAETIKVRRRQADAEEEKVDGITLYGCEGFSESLNSLRFALLNSSNTKSIE